MPTFDAGTVEGRLTLDRSPFNRELAAARADARRFEQDPIRARLDVDKRTFDRKTADVQRTVSGLDKARARPKIDADTDAFERQMRRLFEQTERISGRTANVSVGADTSVVRANTTLARVQDQLNRLHNTTVEPKIRVDQGGVITRRIGLIKTALIGLSPAAVPILGATTAAVLGLSGALTAGAGAAGIFGAAVIGNVVKSAEFAKEIKKLNEELGNTSDVKKRTEIEDKLADTWARMDSDQRQFQRTLQVTSGVWDGFLASTRPQTLDQAGRALGLLEPALRPLPPLVGAFESVIGSTITRLDAFVRGNGYREFLGFIADEGPPALENVIDLMANLTVGTGHLIRAFTPFGQDFLSGLTEGSERFRAWARDVAQTDGFQRFMDYIAENGPRVVEMLGSIIDAGVHLAEALAPLGGPALALITGVANGLGAIADVAPGLVQAALVIGTVTRAIGALGDAQVAIRGKIQNVQSTFDGAAAGTSKWRGALSGAVGLLGGPWGLALAGGTIALGYFATAHAEGQQRVQDFTAALREEQGALDGTVKQQAAMRLEQEGALASAEKLGISVQDVTRAVLDQDGSLDGLLQRLRGIAEANKSVDETSGLEVYNNQGRAALNLARALEGVNGELGKGLEAYNRTTDAAGEAITTSDGLEAATHDQARAYDDAKAAINEKVAALQADIDKMKEARDVALGLRDSQRGYEQALDDFDEVLKENGKTFDINTQKGRDNQAALDAIATSANKVAEEISDPGKRAVFLESAREEFIEAATQGGIAAGKAKELADQLIKTPAEVKAEITVETQEQKLKELQDQLTALDGRVITSTGKFDPDKESVFEWTNTLGTEVPAFTLTYGNYDPDKPAVSDWSQLLTGVPRATNTRGNFDPETQSVFGYIGDLGQIPGSKSTRGNFSADSSGVNAWLGELGGIPRRITTYVGVSISGANRRLLDNAAATGGVVGLDGRIVNSYAGGGVVPGIDRGRDEYLAAVRPEEGILVPDAVAAIGGAAMIHALNRAANAGALSSLGQMGVASRGGRSFHIENYYATTVQPTEREALMDTSQELSLMFGDLG